MVAWYWIIIAFILGNAFVVFTCEYFEWDSLWAGIVAFLALIVLYPALVVYNVFFKNTIHPVPRELHEKLKPKWLGDGKSKCFNFGNNFYFWFDPQAKKLFNKIFFVRIIDKPIDK